jgi:predicted dehydrogenase
MSGDLQSLGAAIIGTGFMCWVHAEALARIGAPLRGVLGSSPEKSKRQAAKLAGVQRAYDDFDQVVADDQVKVIHLATPNRLHFEQAKRALVAGKHVMCEKPLATNSIESHKLVEFAAKHPKQACGVNYNIRFYPLCIEMRERIARGDLGEMIHISGSYTQDWLLQPTDYNWRVLASEGGELRAVADIGTHWLDLAHAVTGFEVEAVCASLKTVHPVRQKPKGEVETFQSKLGVAAETIPVNIDTEDCGNVLLRLKNGALGMLGVSQVTAGRKNCLRLEISGSKQSFAWNSEIPNELWIGHRDKPNEVLIRDPALLSPAARAAADYPGGHNEGYDDSFKQCFRSFYSYIAAGDFAAPRPFPTFADGHREILLCEAILKSHRQQRWVNVKEST